MPRALIVDDEKSVRVTLRQFLLAQDYEAEVAPDATEALRLLDATRFDVVITDILLPGLSGVELLKAIRTTSPGIQVIMMTAEPTLETAAEAVRAGASDYLTKPVGRNAIVRAVATAARIKALEDAKQREQAERERYQQELEDAVRRLTSANEQLRQAAEFREEVEQVTRHDLKSPLNVILGAPDLIRTLPGKLSPEQLDWLARIERAGQRLLEMINRSLDLFRIEQGMYALRPQPVDLVRVVLDALQHGGALMSVKQQAVEILMDGRSATDSDSFVIEGERLLCLSMIENLTKNALEAAPHGETVTICFETVARRLTIRNRGEVPGSVRERFFEKFSTAGKDHGTGLGTYSARLVAELHGAQIAVDTSEPGFTTVALGFEAVRGAPHGSGESALRRPPL